MGSKQGAIKIAASRVGLTVQEYIARIAAGLKWCTACKDWHPVASFGIDNSRGDGLSSICTARRYVRKHSGPTKAERRQQRAKGMAWCRGCADWLPLDKIQAGMCRTHHAAYERTRYANDPRYRVERRQHAHSRKRGVDPVPVLGGEYRLDTTDGRCIYCGAPATTWDHLYPISKGGSTQADNIVPACGPCNSSKGDRDVWEWLRATGRRPETDMVEFLFFLWEAQGHAM